MSATGFKRGDRVKVTYEGEIVYVSTCAPGCFDLRTDCGYRVSHDSAIRDAIVEKIAKPLPTTPGSLIQRRCAGAFVYRILASDGYWFAPGDRRGLSVRDLGPGYEVVYDAGKGTDD